MEKKPRPVGPGQSKLQARIQRANFQCKEIEREKMKRREEEEKKRFGLLLLPGRHFSTFLSLMKRDPSLSFFARRTRKRQLLSQWGKKWDNYGTQCVRAYARSSRSGIMGLPFMLHWRERIFSRHLAWPAINHTQRIILYR